MRLFLIDTARKQVTHELRSSECVEVFSSVAVSRSKLREELIGRKLLIAIHSNACADAARYYVNTLRPLAATMWPGRLVGLAGHSPAIPNARLVVQY